MAIATDQQVQQYVNERLRVRAESLRKLMAQLRDDKAALNDVYERAADGPWADSRADGPPRLLNQQDVLVYNTIVTMLIRIIDGTETGTEQEIANQRAATIGDLRANWPVFQSACVRPVE